MSTAAPDRPAAAAPAASSEAAAAPPPAPPPSDLARQAWLAACVCACLALAVLSSAAAVAAPRGQAVQRIAVEWLPGPQAPQREIDHWLASFPEREQLAGANEWVMAKLADHLRSRPGVATVGRLRLTHERSYQGGQLFAHRTLSVELGMRRPYMPALLASGARVWVDAEGVVLPGSLPPPEQRRPTILNLEQAPGRLRAAVEAWRAIEPLIEPGIITAIDCHGPLDERGGRGIVLHTAAGCRLVWGDAGDERFGRGTAAKARDLAHALRCQGDLSRVATVNVRFPRPFYTLR